MRRPQCTSTQHRMGGFSMLEFTNGLSALAVLGMAVVSGVHDFILDNQRCAVVNQLITGLRMARTAANETAQVVTVCPSADGRHCRDDGNWNQGWLAFVDLNGDGAMQSEESRHVLARALNTSPRVTIASAQPHFSFMPFYARPFTAHSTRGTLCIRDSRGAEHARTITLDTLGPARLTSRRMEDDSTPKQGQHSRSDSTECA